MGGVPLDKPVVGMVSTPQVGYYEVACGRRPVRLRTGSHFHGSMGGQPLVEPVVGMAGTPQGGYFEVARDGGLFAFGPGATFAGSEGGRPLSNPVVGMAVNPTGGYYEVGSDGGIFAFGAPFHGSAGCLTSPTRSSPWWPRRTYRVGSGAACDGRPPGIRWLPTGGR